MTHGEPREVRSELGAPYHHPAAWPDEKLLGQCTLDHGRTSGPGGQHRNRVATEVTLTHTPTGLKASAGERRSAEENKHVALRRMRLKLAVEYRTGARSGEDGSPLWKSRLVAAKRRPSVKKEADPVLNELGVKLHDQQERGQGMRIACNPKHHDYPALLSEAMDAIEAAAWEPRGAADRLGVSMSQLLKFVKDYAPAWVKLNQEREVRGMHRLK